MSLPFPCLPKTILQTTSGHGALRMRGSSFASCPRRWRLRFRSRLKHSMLGSKNFISILRQSRMCSAIRQLVTMHTTKRRFSGSKQRMIISKVSSTTRNGPSACCPQRNNAAGAPRPPRQPPQPCLLRRRRRDREPLQGPQALMTRRTTTSLVSQHLVPTRQDAKPGRRFYVPNQRLCAYSVYSTYSTYSVYLTHCTYSAYFAFITYLTYSVYLTYCTYSAYSAYAAFERMVYTAVQGLLPVNVRTTWSSPPLLCLQDPTPAINPILMDGY
jgi:hypothetical protein